MACSINQEPRKNQEPIFFQSCFSTGDKYSRIIKFISLGGGVRHIPPKKTKNKKELMILMVVALIKFVRMCRKFGVSHDQGLECPKNYDWIFEYQIIYKMKIIYNNIYIHTHTHAYNCDLITHALSYCNYWAYGELYIVKVKSRKLKCLHWHLDYFSHLSFEQKGK